eukprot:10789653-Alexandrium_andersonii.AAC.1
MPAPRPGTAMPAATLPLVLSRCPLRGPSGSSPRGVRTLAVGRLRPTPTSCASHASTVSWARACASTSFLRGFRK